MFGIDFSEILVIFGIALVVLGPERLPKLANTIGRWVGRARAMARQFRDQLEAETHTLHKDMDLGAEFSNRPGTRPGTGGTTARPTANASTAAVTDPAAGTETATGPWPPAGHEHDIPLMFGPPLPPMELADTHPAGLHSYAPPQPAPPPSAPAASSPVVPTAAGSDAAQVASQDTATRPPDGAP